MNNLNSSGTCMACSTPGATRWCGWAWPDGWAGKPVGQWACSSLQDCAERIYLRVMTAQRAEVAV